MANFNILDLKILTLFSVNFVWLVYIMLYFASRVYFECEDLISQKFPDVGEQRIQIKDADFQVLCDLEDVEQLYSGAKLIIEESMEIESRKVDDATMTQLQNEMEQLRKENFQLRNQIEQQQPSNLLTSLHSMLNTQFIKLVWIRILFLSGSADHPRRISRSVIWNSISSDQ